MFRESKSRDVITCRNFTINWITKSVRATFLFPVLKLWWRLFARWTSTQKFPQTNNFFSPFQDVATIFLVLWKSGIAAQRSRIMSIKAGWKGYPARTLSRKSHGLGLMPRPHWSGLITVLVTLHHSSATKWTSRSLSKRWKPNKLFNSKDLRARHPSDAAPFSLLCERGH